MRIVIIPNDPIWRGRHYCKASDALGLGISGVHRCSTEETSKCTINSYAWVIAKLETGKVYAVIYAINLRFVLSVREWLDMYLGGKLISASNYRNFLGAKQAVGYVQ